MKNSGDEKTKQLSLCSFKDILNFFFFLEESMFSAIQLSGIQNICGQTLEFDENRALSIVMLSDNSLISCSLTVSSC